MSDKKERFLKKAVETFPKLHKEELIMLSKNLIQERQFIFNLIENNPTSVIVYKEDEIIFKGKKIDQLIQEIPNLIFSIDIVGVIAIQDIHFREHLLEINHIIDDDLNIFYISEIGTVQEITTSQKIEDGLGALENLAAGISHEIKNPLSAIDIHTQAIQRQIDKKQLTVPQEMISYLSIIQKESSRLLNVLEEFINMTRKIKPQLVFVEVSDILTNIIQIFKVEAKEKGISLKMHKDNVPKIFTAPISVQQAVSDLIRNAMEAVEKGKVKKILLSLTEDKTKNYLTISIEDSGEGIPINIRNRIFEPYFTTKKNGTGLGLTFVKKMIQEIGGFILIKDSKLGGVSFQIYLPISQGQKKLSYKR